MRHYIDFCNTFSVSPAHPSIQDLCVLVEYLADSLHAPGSILNYVGLLRRHAQDANYDMAPWRSHRLSLALDAVNRDKSHIPFQRPVVEPHILYQVFKYMAARPHSVPTRLAIAILYLSALRQGEVLIHSLPQFDPHRSLTRADMYIHQHKLHLFIKSAKNMKQHDKRRTVTLQRTGDPLTCPVTLYRDMLTRSPTRHPRQPAITQADGRPLTVAAVTLRLRQALHHLGLTASLYTLHSLRRSATTNAFMADISPVHVQHSAAWSSQAYLQYIHADSQTKVNSVLSNTLASHNHS